MKNSWVTKAVDEFSGMESAEPPDRIETLMSALLVNGHVDRTGRVRKQHGVSMVATGSSYRMTATSGRLTPRSGHVYQGRNGQNPSSRLLTVLGGNLFRSQENDLMSAHEIILFPANIDTPVLNKAAAGVFRQKDFYHQNGVDVPFKVACETDDGTAPSTTATVLGLIPPAYCFNDIAANGVGTRFPINRAVGYCMTFVYGERGESGPSPVQYVQYAASGVVKFDLRDLQPAPAGCTIRRIYRTQIGRTQVTTAAASTSLDYAQWEKPANSQLMALLTEITDSATTAYSDDKNDSSLDFSTLVPPPRPFPPISKYQVFHLDRIFWSNVREHPYVAEVISGKKNTGNTFVSSSITISNTGNGTITLNANEGTPRTTTVANYKTKTLAAIEKEINVGYTIYDGAGAQNPTFNYWIFKITAGIDANRRYTFKEVTTQSILASAGAFQLVAIDDTATEGLRWFPNRTVFSEIAFPEQVDLLNSFDITTGGSKKITGSLHSELDASLILFTEDKPFIVSGDFVPAIDTGVPVFRIDPAIANVGNICYRPDATSPTDIGDFYTGYDALRLFRGEKSVPAGREVQNWFARILREPVTRDQLSMNYHGGLLRIALPTEETPS